MKRRALLAAPFLAMARPAGAEAGGGASGGDGEDWPRRITDMAGREVVLKAPPRRVALAESAVLLNLTLIHPDPVPLLVGMGGDLRQIDAHALGAMTRRWPALAQVPLLSRQVGEDLPVERLVALAPDVVIMAAWQQRRAGTAEALRVLDSAGVPVVFVDFFINPLRRALPSLQLLGEVFGRRAAAAEYAAFYEAKLTGLRQAVAGRTGPLTLLQAFPGRWPCCWVSGEQGGGELLAALGGRNAARGSLATPGGGTLGLEQMLALEAEVYIGTGVSGGGGEGEGIRLGWGVEPAQARRSFARVLQAPELAHLPAIGRHRTFGLWNPLGGTALNIVALEAMAGWLYPDLAPRFDPAASLAEINRRFAAQPWEGTFWTGA
ncbi:ABC transporter substrate-binding protein [Roseomonas sp. GC11]|uniref:ABC transporter substrate-binding protein n=1 Tax=Roseomonas sp. GC11 TaxID=2950546 RepID=UPI00210AB539|nr:ABC transporter substrate-binding protein [Roseomonas sp. GC11]MCQ4160306.1 ABC transporter substrate-binding protein [Roseomonas sp. GC11]